MTFTGVLILQPSLEEEGWKIEYMVDNNGREEVTVETKEKGRAEKKPWKEFLKSLDQNKHEMIRTNVLLATRNFQHRVEMFKK